MRKLFWAVTALLLIAAAFYYWNEEQEQKRHERGLRIGRVADALGFVSLSSGHKYALEGYENFKIPPNLEALGKVLREKILQDFDGTAAERKVLELASMSISDAELAAAQAMTADPSISEIRRGAEKRLWPTNPVEYANFLNSNGNEELFTTIGDFANLLGGNSLVFFLASKVEDESSNKLHLVSLLTRDKGRADKSSLRHLAYGYADVPLDRLRKYVAAFRAPAIKSFAEKYQTAQRQVIEQAVNRLHEDFESVPSRP